VILDSSVLVAIIRQENEAAAFAAMIEDADCRISAASYVEAAVVVDSARDPIVSRWFDDLIRTGKIEIEPVTATQARIARAAYRDFGKGSGHPAQLNFGDCFAYALAKDLGEALLFKGSDFAKTDVKCAQ